jgi:putative ABC transport system permease protein
MLLKNPGVSAVAVLTLALGIGANTALFSVVNGVLLRPLSYKNPERLVSLWENVPGYGQWRVSPANFFDWKRQNSVFEDVSAFGANSLTLTGQGDPEQILGTRVSPGYFAVVGVEPMLGRPFLPEEYETGKDHSVILGYSFWQSRFGGNQQLINKTITLNDASYTVVGVMPPGIYPVWPTTSGHISFDQGQQQFWTPMSFTPGWAAVRSAHVLGVIARVKPNVTLAQAQVEMNTIGARLEQEYATNKGEGIIVSPFMNEMVGDVKPALLTLLAAVGVVLLIACANIAGLLLAQHAARTKEIAIRAALGAGRERLVRQFFIEGMLLSLLGTAAGIFLSLIGTDLILKIIPQKIPRLDQVHIDLRVLGFTFLLSLVTCLLFGLVPAWHASKPDLQTALEQSGRSSGPGAGRRRFRQLLVVFQVGMAVILVTGAGLLIKSFWLLQRVDPGFKAEHVLSMEVSLPFTKYSEPQQINAFFKQMNERIASLPGVQSATVAYDNPLEANWIDEFSIEGRPALPEGERPSASFIPVGYDYFRTLGVQIAEGRTFTPQDDQDHPAVAIVNEAFVRKYFPNERAMGQHIRPGPPNRIWKGQKLTSFEIVGIARDVKSSGLGEAPDPAYYLPASQAPLQDMTILVRTQNDPFTLVPALRQVVLSVDPSQPVSNITTLEQVVSEGIAQPRLNMILMGLFGALALILAAVGLYGLMSFAVTQRTQEMGIRMALGAEANDVLKLVLKQGMNLAFIGEAIGLFGAFALTRLLQKMLFGVTPTDTTIFIAVVGVLTTIALLACYLPARRATKVDPLVALRYE